jgi:DNA-binding IclR family transcriptional regulator
MKSQGGGQIVARMEPRLRETRTERALLLLEYLASSNTPPTHAEIGRALGIHRSTLSDLLADLRALGYVDFVDRRYVLGPRMLSLVYRATRQGRTAWIRPTLEELAAATGETAVYSVEIGSAGATCGYFGTIDMVESPNAIRYTPHLGAPYPLPSGAAGLVILAFSDRTAADALAGTDATADDVAALDAELARIRERGYALSLPQSPGRAISAPVTDSQGAVVGALSAIGPRGRFDDPERVWPVLRDAVERLEGRPSSSHP